MAIDLYVCGIWFLALKEGLRLRVFENRVHKVEKVKTEWRKVQDGEFPEVLDTKNIRLIKSTCIGWFGNVALVNERHRDS